MKRVKIGLLGLGRLGKIYADNLSGLPQTELCAVCDTDQATLEGVADRHGVGRFYSEASDLIGDSEVEAVVIATPTHTHRRLVEKSLAVGKPVLCEKPLSISLADAMAIQEAVNSAGVFFQMGFMRRFDPAYAAAKRRLDQGELGDPVLFKSSSRDPCRPSLSYLDRRSSGGLIVDMGIHDFDLAIWFFGPVKEVSSVGGILAYPELEAIDDIDNAVVTLTFVGGQIGVIDLSRRGVYGYDIRSEILGTAGTIQIGYLRETPLQIMTSNQVAHDTVPYFPQRFARAYRDQLKNFAQNLIEGRPAPVTVQDGLAALRLAIAADQSQRTGLAVKLDY